ncbi:mavicyanin-like [Gastrolobium bilobum]|uniref:mavicyanin-like n=1 Tax=Gastrolobium bilobum TaxID=150636 RepID=UPI002AB2780F|nr:mavicyanin-like [Gastrolobium bilobum]
MGGTSFFKSCTFLLAILTLLCSFLLNCVMASVYTVGDQEEWSSQTNYASWAEGYNFSLGDVLVFKYVKGQHNVYEVKEDTFRSCDASSGVLAKYESGEDQVTLNEVKRYWFICNIAGHCLGGMRFGVLVKDSNNVTTATNSTDGAFTPQIVQTPSDNSCTSYISERLRVIGKFIPFGLLLFNLYF